MSQVKKMNNGGNVQKMKYGSIIKNGTRYEMTEESMKRLEQHIATADPDIQQSLANDWELLKSGQDVTIDTFSNQRSTTPSDFSEGQLRRLGKDKPVESKWHARYNTDIHKYNKATQYLGKFDPSANEVETDVEKTKIGRGSSKFEYRINPDGTKTYSSLPNEAEMKLYDQIGAYLMGDDEYRSQYDISKWSDFKDIDTWYKGLNNPNFIKDLRNKILNGSDLTPDEEDYLIAIGLGSDAVTAQKEQELDAELKAKQDTAWNTFNAKNIWDESLRDKQFFYDPNTDTYQLDSKYIPSNLPTDTQGYWFNDDFLNQYSGYEYDWLGNKIFFDKEWYTYDDLINSESQLYQKLNNPNNNYYNKIKSGNYKDADAVLRTDWDGVYYVPTMTDETVGRMGSMYQNPNLRYIETNYNRPGTTYKGLALDDTYNIWRYQDYGDSEGMDDVGRRPERWTITDAYGNPIYLDGSVERNGIPTYNFYDFAGLYDGSTPEDNQKISYVDRVSLDPNDKNYYNRYADTPLTDINGNKIIEGWIDPFTKTAHVAINKAWGGTEETVFTNMPSNVYSAIKDLNFANNLNSANNRVLLDEFKKLIQGKKSKITADNLISLGMSQEIAPYVIDYFKEYWTSNPTITYRPKMKNGGTLHLQTGGPVKHVGSERFVSDKVNQLAAQMQNPTASKVIGNGSGLTDMDKNELAALAIDLSAFITGLIPGLGDTTNIVAGQGANIMRLAIDKHRKEEGLDTRPWLNYLGSTGADIISIIPVLGDAVNLGDFGKKAYSVIKKIHGPITTTLTAAGLYSAVDAVNKIYHREDLTIEDLQALSTGLQSLTGLGIKAGMKIGDANLASKVQPKQEIKHEFKFKNGETDITKVLDAEDIKALTDVRGRTNIDAELTRILKAKLVPEDQIPEIVKSFNYKNSGLELHQYGKLGKDKVTVIEPESNHNALYYMMHSKGRQDVLSKAKATDIASSGYPKAAARWFWKTGKTLPEGFKLESKEEFRPLYSKVIGNRPKTDELDPAIVTADTPKPKTEVGPKPQSSQNLETKPTTINTITEPAVQPSNPSNPEIKPVETNQHFGSQEFDEKFTQYQAFIRGEGNSPSTKQFKQRFEEYAKKDDFKKLAEDNPELVRLMVDEEISNVLDKGKRTRSSENKLKREIESIKKKHGLTFKTGGILKGQNGLGQHVYELTERAWMPEAINQTLSLARLDWDLGTNKAVENIKAKGLVESANAQMKSNPQEIYSRQTINAGNAERQLGNSMSQSLPPVNSDYIKYAAMKRAGDDASALHFANATLADSQQHSENLAKQTEEQRMYANIRNQIEAENRAIQASKLAGLSELSASKTAANRQSFANYLYEKQTAFDQNRAKMEEALTAENRIKWQKEAESGYHNELQEKFGKIYNSSSDKGNYTLEQWLAGKPQYATEMREIAKRWSQYITDRELAYTKNQIPNQWLYKSGGKMRSAADQIMINKSKANDQIKINKNKSFDKNWEDTNKSVRKAVGKMHDRVHDILMKILS